MNGTVLRRASLNVSSSRRGVAIMAAVVVLVIVALMMSAIAWQIIATGRIMQHREYQLQAESLARAGIEVALGRLLDRPVDYHGEILELIERSTVTIEVKSEPDQTNTYYVTSLARYPTDLVSVVTRKQTRTYQRVTNVDTIHLKCTGNSLPVVGGER